MNRFEVVARIEKAQKLAEVLETIGCSSEDAMRLTNPGWTLTEMAAQTRPSSDKTRELVASILRMREAKSDPFARF